MRTGTSDILSQGHSGRLRLDARLRRARKSQNYRIDLEGLESRTLLATIPAATPDDSGTHEHFLADGKCWRCKRQREQLGCGG